MKPFSQSPQYRKKRIESLLFTQFARLCDFQPGTHIELEFEGIIANHKQCRGPLSLRRGDGNRFKIEVHLINVPIPIQKFSVGRDDHGILWCSGTRNIVVYGSENLVNEPVNEPALPQAILFSHLQNFFSNIFRIVAKNPSLVKQFAQLSTNQKDCLILELAKSRIFLQFQLNATGTYPEKLTIKVKGFSGTVTISPLGDARRYLWCCFFSCFGFNNSEGRCQCLAPYVVSVPFLFGTPPGKRINTILLFRRKQLLL